MKVAYIIYNERPLSGLIRTQVISLLKEIKRQGPHIDITLISFWQPWVYLKYRRELREMASDLLHGGVKLEIYPWAVIPSRYFLYNAKLFPILHGWVQFLYRWVHLERFHIVHGRSYFATLIPAELKKKYGYKCVFDMRSMFVKERVTVKMWAPGDANYQMWADIERKLMALSDAAIAVSEPMVDEILAIDPRTNAVLIPICSDTESLFFDPAARTTVRKEMGLENRLVIAYEGSLGNSNLWNNIHNYGKYFSFILRCRPDAFFLVLTPESEISFAEILSTYGIPSTHLRVLEASGQKLRSYLSAADIGMHVMSPGPDSHTRLGVKVTEYLSCGLPIIVNSNVGGAAAIANEYGVGATIDLDDTDQATAKFESFLADLLRTRERCRPVAEQLFSLRSCAKRYIDLYTTLLAAPRNLVAS